MLPELRDAPSHAVRSGTLGRPPPPPAPTPIGLASAEHRVTPRCRLPVITPVAFNLEGGAMAHATLRDLSRFGVGLARRGRLALAAGTVVMLQFHLPGSDQRIHREAQVRWSHFAGFNTYLGLRFTKPLPAEDPLLLALLGRPCGTDS
jgi:hypothetical protein